MYFDPVYIIFALPAFLIAIGAQLLVKYNYSKYSKVGNQANLTGIDVVEKIAKEYGINIKANISLRKLSDHYNPTNQELTLSDQVARSPSIASVGIAAHEMGHALQHKNNMVFFKIRNLLVPFVNIGSSLGYILFLVGIFLNFFGLAIAGVVFFAISTIFVIITLPIEIDASIKAMNMVKRLGILTQFEIRGARNVLTAAALTYVAAIAQSLSSLLYFLFSAMGLRSRD